MSPAENGVDLAAVARVARTIDLRDIRVIKVEASCSPSANEALEPHISFETSSALVSDERLNVICMYDFSVNSGAREVATAQVAYLMMYEVLGGQLDEKDIEHFARANGIYHSWPFLRQFLFDLTSKMGFPPLTLPVFQVIPRANTQHQAEEAVSESKPRKRKAPQKVARK